VHGSPFLVDWRRYDAPDATARTDVGAGDKIIIKTPGGGGFGTDQR